MAEETNSNYNAYSSNYGGAVSNTFEAVGMKGEENYGAPFSYSGFSNLIGPSAIMPADPNSMYSNTIFNNPQKFITEILR